MRVREGDLLIMSTDGVFDNLFQEEIIEIIKSTTKDNAKTKQIAYQLSQRIAEAAYIKSKMSKVKCPFTIRKAQLMMEY